MTNNYPQLLGVETKLRELIQEYNYAVREGTLPQMRGLLSKIEGEAREAGYAAEGLCESR